MGDDSSWSAQVTRRRVLGSVMTIGAASAAAGAGTVALFRDSETSSGNAVQAGTLDLRVSGAASNTVVNLPNVEPDTSGQTSATVRNAGSLPGYLTARVSGFRTPENGVNEAEADAAQETDTTGGPFSGELAQNIELRMELVEEDGTTHEIVGDGAGGKTLAASVPLGPRDLGGLRLSAGETLDFDTFYEVYNAGNEIQSDGLEIDLAFGLAQAEGQTVLDGTTEVDARAIGPDEDDVDAGVSFSFTNDTGQRATIDAIHVQPSDTDLELLSDRNGGTAYSDFTYDADAHVASSGTAGEQDGWVDGGPSSFPVPGWLDLTSDGWSDAADQPAVVNAGNQATVSLYAFRNRSGNKEDMAGTDVRVDLVMRLADGTRANRSFAMTPQ